MSRLEFRVLPSTLWHCTITFRKSCNSSFALVWGCKSISCTFFCLFSALAFLSWRLLSCIFITSHVYSKVSQRVKRTVIVGSCSYLGSFKDCPRILFSTFLGLLCWDLREKRFQPFRMQQCVKISLTIFQLWCSFTFCPLKIQFLEVLMQAQSNALAFISSLAKNPS